MSTSYHYSAYCYLDQWLEFDRRATRILGCDSSLEDSSEEREQLARVAQYYGVIRNFKKDEPRLERALCELNEVRQPSSEVEAIESVTKLVGALATHYGFAATSAASKFLWMRFQRPVVIFDSLAAAWLAGKNPEVDTRDYAVFCGVWRSCFQEYEAPIRIASLDLLRAKDFFRPNDLTESELEETLASPWFIERVFDHYICNNGE